MDSNTAYYTMMYLYYSGQHEELNRRGPELYDRLNKKDQMLWEEAPSRNHLSPFQIKRAATKAADWLSSSGRIAHAQQMEEALYEE